MSKRDNIIHKVALGLFTAHTLFSVVAYFAMYDATKEAFLSLGVSTSIIYPLAIAKLLGIIAILTKKSKILKELAYLGFAIDFVLAIFFHLKAGDGDWPAAFVVLIVTTIAYVFEKRVSKG